MGAHSVLFNCMSALGNIDLSMVMLIWTGKCNSSFSFERESSFGGIVILLLSSPKQRPAEHN
jgi:hypothetical protein